MTSSPGCFSTGSDSPVIIDSSTALAPSTTTPSTGNLSPGRTSTMSPASTSSTGMSVSTPSRNTRAVFGCRPTSFLIASEVLPLALLSSARPSTTSAITTVTTSQNASASFISGNQPGNSTAAIEYRYAAVTPSAIKVCILAERCLRPSHMPVKNCEPDQAITGSARIPTSIHTTVRLLLPIGIHSRRPGMKSG